VNSDPQVKTRMQISGAGSGKKEYRSSLHCIQTIVSKEGPLALYQGIGAALLRQATYTTGRLGMYTYLNDLFRERFQRAPGITDSMAMGTIAGACGAFIGTPADIDFQRGGLLGKARKAGKWAAKLFFPFCFLFLSPLVLVCLFFCVLPCIVGKWVEGNPRKSASARSS